MTIEFTALLALLATYRLTLMLNSEVGPADIFGRLRTWLGVVYDQYSNPQGTNWISEGVLCFYCLSVWIGFAVTLVTLIAWLAGHAEIAVFALMPFAVSGGAVFLKKWTG